MNTRQHTAGLALVSLTLLLTACGGSGTVTPPPTGTSITSTADSGAGSLRDLLGSAADGDTLKLASGTITLAGPLKVTKSVTLDLGSSVIDAAGKGRALEIPSGVTVTIKGGTLKGGTGAPITVQALGKQAVSVATYGGVLLNEGTLTLDGTAITGGTANVGGGIANFKTGTLVIKGTSSVTGNTAGALPTDATEDSGIGGGVFNKGSLTISGGSISTNTASYAGGGIYGGVGSLTTLSSGKVDGNTATAPVVTTNDVMDGSMGGGIYSNGNVTITGGSVSGNTVAFFGGGIAVQPTLDAQGNLIKPQVTLSGGTLENNRVTDDAGDSGGAVWANGDFTMTGGTVMGNSAPYGGGLALFRDASITGGTIEANQARTKSGGGILAYTPTSRPAPSVLTFGGTATVKDNTAGDSGGGVLVDRTTLTMTGGTVTGNTAVNSGGGIGLNNTDSTIQGGVISNNTVSGLTDGGGGIRIFSTSKLTLSGGEISGNTTARTGGGVLVGGEITMTGGTIKNNVVTDSAAHQGGGGVRLYAGTKMTASGGTISGNKARWGAGVVIDGPYQTSPNAEFILSGASVTGNVVTDPSNNGGGFLNGGKLTITSGSVTGNTATQNGGGVFNQKSATYAQPGGSVTSNAPDNVFNEQ
ncbi:hypothetical protein GCM10022631_25090 [Deinococcus rubellus]|uniref:beta strand repeat-containing protein n=1 Tax=Deinococcus rubellus TaxID=1889240 RepID=UPI0031E9720E